ncbi:hypothetical protein COCON_G00089200 [Conger conger]|uniref:RNA polymerase II subunit B1 CTD phosphatase RPAP2 homolog n=1 Tax=Conger conger TaxID=82655 RepID=A0A9Q1I0R2_CONCO|nr:hypothetical protein COCON_G00089200 [Conger conger]
MDGGQKRSSRSPKSGKKVSFAEEKAVKAQAALEAAKRREVVKETVRQKFEFEQRALCIVERLLEDEVSEDFLIDCARFITPSNYRDTVEERNIARMCGYPVCTNKLGSVPKQQFKISTKTNKVYDITERKCFCSNFCFKASKHFEVQISKTPLWLREKERLPDVKLLKKGESGSSGEEVKISDRPIRESEIENPEPAESAHPVGRTASGSESQDSDQEQDFVSSVVTGGGAGPKGRTGILKHGGERERNAATAHTDEQKDKDMAQEHTAETARNEDGDKPPERDEHKDRSKPQQPNTEVDEERNRTRTVTDKPNQTVEATTDLLSVCRVEETDTRVDDGVEQPAADCTPVPGMDITQVGMSRRAAAELRKLLKDPADAVRAGLLERLSKTLREWRTEETMRLLHGPSYRPREEGEEEKEEEEEELDEDDLEDSVEAPASQGLSGGGQGKPSATAPDYDTLHRETERLNLRVQEFYRGSPVLPEENGEPEDTSGWDPALPLVDSHAQHLIQKRIVSEKLNRSLRDIVGPLQLTMNNITTDINNLIRTFRFTNANIIHKSPEWTLIAVVLLSVLSDVIVLLQESLEKPSAMQYISTLMAELRLTDSDLHSLVQLFRVRAK